MRKILFASYNGADFSTIEPLFKLLRAEGVVLMMLRGIHPPGQDRLKGIKSFDFEAVKCRPLNGETVIDSLKSDFKQYLFSKFKRELILEYVNSWRRIERRTEEIILEGAPDLVVLSPGWVESAFISEVCQRLRANYCYLLPSYYEFKTIEFYDIRQVPYLVAGEAGRERLIKKGVFAENIRVTGNPVFDDLFRFRERNLSKRNSVFRQFNKSGSEGREKRILFTAQNIAGDETLFQLLGRYLKARKNVRLFVRPHPASNPNLWKSRIRSCSSVEIASSKRPLNQDILKADILVTESSACILNAFVLGIPALSFKSDFFPKDAIFTKKEDVLTAENYAEIQEALDRVLFDEKFREAWTSSHRDCYKRYLSFGDGSSAARVTDVLIELSKKKPALTDLERMGAVNNNRGGQDG